MTDNALRDAASRSIVASGSPTVRQLVEKQKDQIARALGSNQQLADQFVRAVLTEMSKTPRLHECTPQSLLGAIMVAAHLGLEPGPMQLVALLPFENRSRGVTECQIIIQYRGYIQLALNSGLVASIEAREVCEADHFVFEYGLNPKLEHSFDLTGERGHILGVYALAQYVNGGRSFIVMQTSQVEQYRARARANQRGPWQTDWPAMARKTAVRRLEPYLPKSTKMATAFAVDGRTVLNVGEENVVQDSEPEESGEDGTPIAEAVVVPQPEAAAGQTVPPEPRDEPAAEQTTWEDFSGEPFT